MTGNRLTDSPGPHPGGVPRLPASRQLSWLITSVIVGWAVVYNAFRIAGRSPRGASVVSLLIGLGLGAIIFGAALLVWRRFGSAARYQPSHLNEIPPAVRLDGRQRAALGLLWPAVALLAVVALVVGVALGADWLTSTETRSATKAVIAGWDILVGAWLAFEATQIRSGHGDAVESIGTAAILTAVLGGVALSREMLVPGQIALIVLAGIAGCLSYRAGWRLLGSRGIPFAAGGALIVAAAAIAFPLL